MHMATLKNLQLHWQQNGDPNGQPVVFANSLGTDLRIWDSVIPLMPKGLRLIRFDKRGHGLSDCPPAPYTMEKLVDDTAQLLDQLGVTSCIFVGLSIGGMIAQSLAARRPDLVGALVLSNTAAKMGDPVLWRERIAAVQADGLEAIAGSVLDRWFANDFRVSDQIAIWENMLSRTPVQGYIGCCQAIAGCDLTQTTTDLRLPTLGIAGSVDMASKPEQVKATVALIPGSRFEVISGAGHLPCVEAPEQYAALLAGFIKEISDV
ncbi:MAG: 3-oxoadipate enol-lactonase [Paracoccaceae bacterium]